MLSKDLDNLAEKGKERNATVLSIGIWDEVSILMK